jgi:hypothetical protein
VGEGLGVAEGVAVLEGTAVAVAVGEATRATATASWLGQTVTLAVAGAADAISVGNAPVAGRPPQADNSQERATNPTMSLVLLRGMTRFTTSCP